MLEALLIAQQECGACYVRLDLSGVVAVDSCGLNALVNAHRRFLATRGTLVLTSVEPALVAALAEAHLDRVLLIAEPPSPSGQSSLYRAELAAS